MPSAAIERIKAPVAGVDLEVRTAGSGSRTILFLHPGDGLEGDNAALAELAGSHRVIAPSHPGFGESALPDHYRHIDDLAYYYLDFLEERKLERVAVVGVSFGAWIAAEIAIKNASRIAGLVLADAVGAKFEGPTVREITDIFSYPMYEHPDWLYADPARRKMKFGDHADDVLMRLARNYESFALFGWSPTLHDPRLAKRLHRIKVPTQFLWGAEDRIVTPAYGRKFAASIAGAGFELIAGAGHLPHVEKPREFAAAVGRFVAALP